MRKALQPNPSQKRIDQQIRYPESPEVHRESVGSSCAGHVHHPHHHDHHTEKTGGNCVKQNMFMYYFYGKSYSAEVINVC